MNDNEIIKALECHKSSSLLDCEKCPLYAKKRGFEKCHIELLDSLYDLINRQKAEIERYKNECFGLSTERDAYKDVLDEAVEGAIKEFAERLKELMKYETVIYDCHIDNLVKEMTD